MYYYLSRAVKRRLIHELVDSFGRHYFYSKITPFIQDKFAYEERPQYGIVVKNVSASRMQLSADNFVGHVISHVQKANVENKDGTSIEWVREDTRAIIENGGAFPSPPGVYYVSWETDTTFMVDPLLSINREFLVEFDQEGQSIGYVVTVDTGLIQPNTLFVYTADRWELTEGTHYTVDYDVGQITFITELYGHRLYADYHYPTDSRGPFTVEVNTFNHDAIPGVILAFGRNMHAEDQSAIVVTEERTLTALEYGGKWDISTSFDVLARDPIQMEEIADLVLMYLWGEKKNVLEFEGILIQDIAHGGEADEVYDETGQELYYMVSMDATITTDWSIHVPVPFSISGFIYVDEADVQTLRTGTDEEVAELPSSLRIIPSLTPYMSKAGLSHNFERIV